MPLTEEPAQRFNRYAPRPLITIMISGTPTRYSTETLTTDTGIGVGEYGDMELGTD